MANGIASEEMVIALGREKILGSFGAAGLPMPRLEAAVQRIQKALPKGPYAFCLIHSPNEPALEKGAVDLYLKYGVKTLEASAFLSLTPHIVTYRVSGLRVDAQGHIEIQNRIIAKVSRREVAARFLQPAPTKMLAELVADGRELAICTARPVSMAEKIVKAVGINQYFTHIYGTCEDSQRQNKKLVIFDALMHYPDLAPERVVMVGDRTADILGAKDNGVDSLAVVFGSETAEQLARVKPTYLVDTVADMADILLLRQP